jgi:hypothetical protein
VAQVAADAPAPQISCQPNGYDVAIRNDGAAPLPAGTVIDWRVPIARMGDRVTLTAPLPPGGFVVQVAVLGSSYLTPRAACEAAVVAP